MGEEKTQYVSEDLDPSLSLEDAKSISSDDALLMSMGKKPELRRVYNFWTRQLMMPPMLWARVADGFYSGGVPDYDLVQLVMSRRSVFDHLRHWRALLPDLGHVRI